MDGVTHAEIILDPGSVDAKRSVDAHHLPCGIVGYSGRANASSYFKPSPLDESDAGTLSTSGKEEQDENGAHKNDCEPQFTEVSLRGRRLIGQRVKLSNNYTAVLLERQCTDKTYNNSAEIEQTQSSIG